MDTSTTKSTHSSIENQIIDIEKALNPKTKTPLPPPEDTNVNNPKAEPTASAKQDREDVFSTANVQRRILKSCYQNDEYTKRSVRRFEKLSLANLWFYQDELRKLEREILLTVTEGRVSERLMKKLRTLLKEYRM